MSRNVLLSILVLALVAYVSAGRVDAQMVTDGLVAYWPLDQATVQGDVVQDIWGENDGTINGDVNVVPGKVGQAMEFDGESSVDIEGTDALNFAGTAAMTVAAWVNADSEEPVIGVVAGCCGTVVGQRDANGWALRFDGRNADAEMEFIVHTGSWVGDDGFGAPAFTPGEWHYVTAVLAEDLLLLYVDGEMVKELPFAGTIASISAETEIGHAQDGGFMGLIDEVVIYNRPLEPEEVSFNFQANGLAVDPDGKLTTYWGRVKVLQ